MIRYLLRRRAYIPNYQLRHESGLWIASTQVEKWNDLAISNRCKHRSMCWTLHGVTSLAVLEAADRNDELTTWRTEQNLLPLFGQVA